MTRIKVVRDARGHHREIVVMRGADGQPVQELHLGDGGTIRRFDPPEDARGNVANLHCYNADGTLRWEKAPPTLEGPIDFFVWVDLYQGRMKANTLGGWLIEIDPKSGGEIGCEFVK